MLTILAIAINHPVESALLALSVSIICAVIRAASRNNPTW
jgi:hypothetical protein